MKLIDYVKSVRKITVREAARDGEFHHESFRLWCNNKAVPRPAEILKIYSWSQGQVTPNDFYELPPEVEHDPTNGGKVGGFSKDRLVSLTAGPGGGRIGAPAAGEGRRESFYAGASS